MTQPVSPVIQAEQRAAALLYAHLTPRQLQTLERDHYIDVIGGSSGRTYRIKVRRFPMFSNVMRLDKYGVPLVAYDAMPYSPYGMLPWADIMLGQMLVLQTDEDHFLTKACKTSPDMAELQEYIDGQIFYGRRLDQRLRRRRTFLAWLGDTLTP